MPGSHDIGSLTLMSPSHPAPTPSAWAGLGGAEGRQTWSPADYMRLLNISTAKCVALVTVLLLGVYHSVLHATYGVTPCKGLLTHGMYKVRAVRGGAAVTAPGCRAACGSRGAA